MRLIQSCTVSVEVALGGGPCQWVDQCEVAAGLGLFSWSRGGWVGGAWMRSAGLQSQPSFMHPGQMPQKFMSL